VLANLTPAETRQSTLVLGDLDGDGVDNLAASVITDP
jgi:hypothetical protein